MPEPGEALSEREMEVLRLVARGLSNDQIAAQLAISTNTVKTHLRNVFAKLDVASRTEASLIAIQRGWVAVETPAAPNSRPAAPVQAPPAPRPVPTWPRWLALSAIVFLLLALTLSMFGFPQGLFFNPRTSPSPASLSPGPRWAVRAEMPTPRSHLILVPFADGLYAIGGQGVTGPSDATERFDPLKNTWTPLAPKPTAVFEARGAVLGGHIYIPGGRGKQGQVVATTEVYLVERNQWTVAAALPRPLSGYALVSFEGKLYLFGGWDGSRYRDEILRYDPDADRWEEAGRLPFPWGHAGAVVISNRILLVGGVNADGPLDVTLDYAPAPLTVLYTRPLSGISLGRVQATVLLDRYLYVMAEPPTAPVPGLWQWNIATQEWQALEAAPAGLYPGVALAGMGTGLFLVGGEKEGMPLSLVQEFQALYVVPVSLPTVRP